MSLSHGPSTPRTLSDLFWAFSVLSLQGFGGVLAVVHRELVDKRRWLTDAEFIEPFVTAGYPYPDITPELMLGMVAAVRQATTDWEYQAVSMGYPGPVRHGHDVFDLHEMVMTEVEKPLLQAALEHAGHNQTKAAKILGLSRSTLRKKMEFYDLS